jgi:hypothetical protein
MEGIADPKLFGRDWITPPELDDMFVDLDKAKTACPRPTEGTTAAKACHQGGAMDDSIAEEAGSQQTSCQGMGCCDVPPMVLAFAGIKHSKKGSLAKLKQYACVFSRSIARRAPNTRLILFTDSVELQAELEQETSSNITVLLAKNAPPKRANGWNKWRYWCAHECFVYLASD